MTDSYHILINGEQQGPYTLYELMDQNLDVHTQVLTPASGRLQNASDLPELYEYFQTRGIYFPTLDNLAGFWWRLLAYLIDSVIISVTFSLTAPGYVLSVSQMKTSLSTGMNVEQIKFNLLVFLINVIYNSLFEATPMRGSIGKKLCRIAVVDADGRRLSFLKALGRNAGKFISSIALGIGYLNILWDEHRQAWHDQWAKTYVIRRD